MVKILRFFIFKLMLVCVGSYCFAQSGDLPMLTNNPETPGKSAVDITGAVSSVICPCNTTIFPVADVSFGVGSRSEINLNLAVNVTDLIYGSGLNYKVRFLDQERRVISASVVTGVAVEFPQADDAQYLLSVQAERIFNDRIAVVTDIGSFIYHNASPTYFSSFLTGIKIGEAVEIMGEIIISSAGGGETFLNGGFRIHPATGWTVLGSAGTVVSGTEKYSTLFFGIQKSLLLRKKG